MGVVGQMGQEDRKKWREKNPQIWDPNYAKVKRERREAINKKYGLTK